MREFKKILCGTDFSESSYHALDYGLRFARHSDGTLLVVHLFHVPTSELLGEHAYTLNLAEVRNQMQALLDQLHATRLQGYPKTELLTDFGDPAQELIRLAGDRDVDLIVTSTHGRSGLSHLIMGSVAEKIIRHAPCPVFVVRADVD
jgi:nucleotide-binding universal stress UspA family protein